MSAFVAVDQLYDALDERTLEILKHRRASGVRRRGWMVRRALVVADLIGLSIAFPAAELICAQRTDGTLGSITESLGFALSLPVWVLAAKIYGLYSGDEERTDHSTTDDFSGVFHLVTVCTWLLFAVSLLSDMFNPASAKLFLFWLLAIALVTGSRAVARAFCRRRIEYLQNTIIVGAGQVGQSIAKKLISHTEYGINLVGFVDRRPKARLEGLAHLTVLGELDDLRDLVKLLDVERVIFAFSNDEKNELLSAIGELRRLDVQVDIVPRLFDRLGPSVAIHTIEGIPLVGLPPSSLPASSRVIKRALDVAGAGIALLVFAPLFALIAVMIRCDSPGPVFYRHMRVGRRGSELNLFKFRTMHTRFCRGEQYGAEEAEAEFARLMSDPELRSEFVKTYKLADDPRVTSLGRWLRRTSIDELPQLLNVLKGDMSLVGPRPLTHDELLEYYGDATAELLQIRPGITGYWQINGRSDLEYDDRVRLDMAYVGGWTLGLDLRILAKTIGVLAGSRGAV